VTAEGFCCGGVAALLFEVPAETVGGGAAAGVGAVAVMKVHFCEFFGEELFP
jgi:hypothetical protein